MSIIYCEKHDRRWDSDKLDECPLCENEPAPADAGLVLRGECHDAAEESAGCFRAVKAENDVLRLTAALEAARPSEDVLRWARMFHTDQNMVGKVSRELLRIADAKNSMLAAGGSK